MSTRARDTARIGRRGTLVIPAALRRRFALEEGAMVIAEEVAEGILLRPALAVPLETYTPERKAEFLLTTAVNRAEYTAAKQAVRAIGLDPARIPHTPPGR